MNPNSLTISEMQQLALHIFNDKDTVEVVFGGSGGGGKTFLICMLALLRCKDYPGVQEGIGRKSLSTLKKTTFATLLGKVHVAFGITQNDFRVAQDGSVVYKNGSKIIPVELDYYPSDPDFTRYGGFEFTDLFIDELGEITVSSYNAIKSRVGRWMNDKYSIPPKIMSTCNPAQNFIRQQFYDVYEKLGEGKIQRWQNGHTVFEGEKIPSYAAFVRSSVWDNPFIEDSYIENLKRLPDRERKRLLDGNWNYADDESSLFKGGLIDKAITYDQPAPTDKFKKYIGVDVSDKGGDKTIFSLISNGVLITQKRSSIQMSWDTYSEAPLSKLLADELIEFAQRNGFTQREARHIGVECNGVGVGIRDMLKLRGWNLTEYTATHKSRSEGYYQLMLDMDSGSLKISHDINTLDDIRKQLSAHTYEMNNQVPSVVKKEIIKQKIGHSPDEADSLMIANHIRNLLSNPQNDPRRNQRRILF